MGRSIRAKMLLIIGGAFVVTVVGLIGLSVYLAGGITREVAKEVDAGHTEVFSQRIAAIHDELNRAYTELQSTLKTKGAQGTDGARGDETKAQNMVQTALKKRYYETSDGGVKGMYPFIVDAQGVVVIHPQLKYGDPSASQADFIKKLLTISEGSFPYSYKGEAKWMFVKRFEPWNWTIGYTIPESVKDAGVHRVIDLLMEFRNKLAGVIVGLAATVILIVAAFIKRSIVRPLQGVIGGLTESSRQVAAASSQVSQASGRLAQGSSDQAASLEETSSSLEEMASMTRKSAENAVQTSRLMDEVSQTVTKVNQHMDQLNHALTDMTTLGRETEKIIKTIEEIAFQTNLLALNAAVEAARAGAAGAGFAVVADEVRKLAMRAAAAAKDTGNLVQKILQSIQNGNQMAKSTTEAFGVNVKISENVVKLVGEISSAAQEQAQGVDHINQAVASMDKVTQQNAASAEESASASQELSTQAEDLNRMVHALSTIVEGGQRE